MSEKIDVALVESVLSDESKKVKSAPKTGAAKRKGAPKAAAKKVEDTASTPLQSAVNFAAANAPSAVHTKILFAASECQPFAATGGLSDVMGSLPKTIAATGADVRVIMPLYSEIGKAMRDKFSFVAHTQVELAWRKQYCGLFSYKEKGVTYYFIDNEYYFARTGLYGHYDDGERFAFFSKCVLDICRFINYFPQIIHCNDWQTGFIPVYLKTLYLGDESFSKIRTVFTIHNIEYQGKFSFDILENVLGIPARFAPLSEYDGNINIVKGAIQCCDSLTTVSPSYAEEIMTPYFSHGLHFVIKENKYKLTGILNGIDYSAYNPETDKALFKNFGNDTIELKAENKAGLQKLLNLPQDADIPMIAVISRLVSHKGIDLIKSRLEDILRENIQFIILGKGDIIYENYFLDMEKSYNCKLKVITSYNPDLARKIYASADIFLMPSKSEPCGLAQMIASRYGTVPVVRETGGLKDSIKDIGSEGGGNGFTFANYNAGDMYNRIMHAVNYYLNKENWRELIKRVMAEDFTWDKSAEKYIGLYKSLI